MSGMYCAKRFCFSFFSFASFFRFQATLLHFCEQYWLSRVLARNTSPQTLHLRLISNPIAGMFSTFKYALVCIGRNKSTYSGAYPFTLLVFQCKTERVCSGICIWNLNYAMDVIKDNPHVVKAPEDVVKDVVKETGDVVKAKANVTKEFVKAQRQIYKLISQTPQINATQMSESMGISLRQVQRYLKQLSDLKLIVREGGRKNGIWKILDEEYEGFFKRI